MTVAFCGLTLAHPVVNAPGSFDARAASRAFGRDAVRERFPFAAYLSGPVAPTRRAGAPPPRLWETPAGLLRASEPSSIGLERYLAEILPADAQLGVPLIATITADTDAELAALAERLGARPELAALVILPPRGRADAPGAAAAERGAAAAGPGAGAGRPGARAAGCAGATPDATALAAAVAAVRARTGKPLVAQLDATAADLLGRALLAEAAGASALLLRVAPPGVAFHRGRRWFPNGPAELVGPAVRPLGLAAVSALAGHLAIPVVGAGGVQRGRHAADLLDAGASLVAVGSESFRDPLAAARIRDELKTRPG